MISTAIFYEDVNSPSRAARTVDNSSNATEYSIKFGGIDFPQWSVHFEWTGTPTATITLWASNKDDPSEADDTDWVQDSTSFTGPAGSASKGFYEIGNSSARYYRFKVVTSGGSGTFQAWVTGSH